MNVIPFVSHGGGLVEKFRIEVSGCEPLQSRFLFPQNLYPFEILIKAMDDVFFDDKRVVRTYMRNKREACFEPQ